MWMPLARTVTRTLDLVCNFGIFITNLKQNLLQMFYRRNNLIFVFTTSFYIAIIKYKIVVKIASKNLLYDINIVNIFIILITMYYVQLPFEIMQLKMTISPLVNQLLFTIYCYNTIKF